MLKNDDTLLNELLSDENLKIAKQRVKKNKGASGIDGMEVKELDEYLSKHLDEIKEQIRNKKYSPKPVKRVEIPKPDGGVRNLGVPTVVDRFVQQAIAQVLTPIYEPKFSESSYGFRPDRCCEMAILKALEFMNDGYQWVVDIDLEKFFDNVNHDKLISLIMKDVKCGEIVSLINKFLKSGIMIDDEYKESVIGTPQGGNLSPLLSNIMLNQLDKELEARGLRFTRYADDCIILVGSSKAADRVMKNVSIFIESKLGLKVNMTKSKVSKPNDIKYLGFGFFMDKNDGLWKAKPHAKSVEKLKLKLKKLTSRRRSISLDERLEKIKKTIVGWTNYYKIGYWKDVARMVDAHVRFRLRMCIWKQWKKPRTKVRNLIKMGVPKDLAMQAGNTRRGHWFATHTVAVNMAMTKERLINSGFYDLATAYQSVHVNY